MSVKLRALICVITGTKMDRLPVRKMNTLPPQEGLLLHQNAESLYFQGFQVYDDDLW